MQSGPSTGAPIDQTEGPPDVRMSGWSPLRYRDFRRWWLANLTSNVGSWMQTVAAQWLMLSLTSSAFLVGAIQATNLPILVLAIPAGVLGDLVDRKRLIIVGQVVMLLSAAALGVLDLAGRGDARCAAAVALRNRGGAGAHGTDRPDAPAGAGPARRAPAGDRARVRQSEPRTRDRAGDRWPAAGRHQRGRRVLRQLGVVRRRARRRRARGGARARGGPASRALRSATRAGGRFVRNSPALLAIMVRAGAFGFFATGLWALLPLVARDTLGLGSGGYGALLGCVGIGAMLGATFSPAIRRSMSPGALIGCCGLAIAVATLVMALSHAVAIDGALLVLAGAGWILALGLLNASFQSALPSWVKARGMAYYTVVFQGATGVGALVLGAVAQATSLDTALVVLAAGLVVGGALTLRLALPKPGAIDVTPADVMPLLDAPAETAGTVLVVVHYEVAPGSEATFLAHAGRLRHFRQRTGGIEWRLFLDESAPGLYVETYLVGSWDEHERQHARVTQHDSALLDELDALLVPGTHRVAHHYMAAQLSRRR